MDTVTSTECCPLILETFTARVFSFESIDPMTLIIHYSTGYTDGWAVIAVRVWLVIVKLMQVRSSHCITLVDIAAQPDCVPRQVPRVPLLAHSVARP